MELTKAEIEKLVEMLPGYAAAYRVGDTVQRLCYTARVPELSGYTQAEFAALAGETATNFVLPADRSSLLAEMERCRDCDEEQECGFHVVKKDGSTVQVWSRVRKIGTLDGAPVMLSVMARASLDELQMDMLNRVPVGMGIYKIERGIPSLVFLNDSYYHLMGFTRQERAIYLGENTIKAVHPDDRATILRGIRTVLTKQVPYYRVVVRMMTKTEDVYHWVQMEGRVARKDGATTYLYVSFTKIDDMKQAQEALQQAKTELEKTQTWLQNAMDSAGIQYFEYFPAEKRAMGYRSGSENAYGIAHVLENYPECLFEDKLAHPEDEASFRSFWAAVNAGQSPVRWEGRFRVGERYNWFRVIATRIAEEGCPPVVTCTMTDINLQREADESYRRHMDSVLQANPDTLALFRLNVTQNRCSKGVSDYENMRALAAGGTMDSFVENAAGMIPDSDGRRAMTETFRREAVLQAFAEGRKSLSVEHRFCLEEGRTEWINTLLDLMKNPETGDVEGVAYALCTTARQMSRVVLENILQRWYDCISVVDIKTDEYYFFEKENGMQGRHLTGFFAHHDENVQGFLTKEEWPRLRPQLGAETVSRLLIKQGSYSTNYFTMKDGTLRRKQANYYYTDRTHRTLIASLRDFSDSDLIEEFRYASEHDPVTDLYNRRKTFYEIRRMLDAHPDERFYVCHIDLQRFRLINSFYGEQAGNDLLAGIGRLMARLSVSYPYAVYGRIEADVFCCCLPAMMQTIEHDVRAVKQWLRDYRMDFQLEANFGAYEITNRALGVEAMFARATLAAKQSRNSLIYHYGFYDDAMERELQNEQQVTNDMKAALEQGQFKVYLQPKVVLHDGTPCGAEALVRWQHPVKGMVAPAAFIPLFEKNGFILQLDRYMWEQVCLLLRRWLDEGRNPHPISVNVSRVSMYSPSTVGFLHDLMEKYALRHSLLQLELTESAYMDDPEEMKKRLSALQTDGFAILMDDFGSGYSSLNTLRELPVDYLKLDMRFLRACDEKDSERSRLILASVIRMANDLHLPVITEGVETAAQCEFLDRVGCTYAQGYLFAKPMPVQEHEDRVM